MFSLLNGIIITFPFRLRRTRGVSIVQSLQSSIWPKTLPSLFSVWLLLLTTIIILNTLFLPFLKLIKITFLFFCELCKQTQGAGERDRNGGTYENLHTKENRSRTCIHRTRWLIQFHGNKWKCFGASKRGAWMPTPLNNNNTREKNDVNNSTRWDRVVG